MQSVWATIEAGWLTALSGIQRSWADFLHAATRSLDGVPGMESTMPTLSEAAIRAGSAFYETAAAAREASSRADGLAASAAAAAGAATAPLASLQALRDAVKGSAEETETAVGGATLPVTRAERVPLKGTPDSGPPPRPPPARRHRARILHLPDPKMLHLPDAMTRSTWPCSVASEIKRRGR